MKYLVIDLETMGKNDNAPIVEIGAVAFDPLTGAVSLKQSWMVYLDDAVAQGGQLDASTVLWWMQQSDAARNRLAQTYGLEEMSFTVIQALRGLQAFVSNVAQTIPDNDYLRVLGNGPTFDLTILRNAYQRVGMNPPWEFWQERDVRTIVDLGVFLGCNAKQETKFVGVQHSALDDALHEAKYVSTIVQHIVTKGGVLV